MKLPSTLKIRVTKNDIKNGEPDQSTYCPIALATMRAIKNRLNVSVSYEMIYIGISLTNVFAYRYKHTPKSRDFVIAFDKKESVKPFTFTARRA